MLRRIVSLSTMLILLSAVALSGNSAAQEPAKGSLDERLGTDDGAALAILFGANMRGNLDPCD